MKKLSHNKEYTDYIQSDAWKAKRILAIAKNRKCLICRSKEHLVVHHRNYNNFMKEQLSDLVVLCESCHNLLHQSHPPNLTIEEHTNRFLRFKQNDVAKMKKQKLQKKKRVKPKPYTPSTPPVILWRRIPAGEVEPVGPAIAVPLNPILTRNLQERIGRKFTTHSELALCKSQK